LVHIYRILRASIRITSKLNAGDTVLVHCSDGWDRTSQIVALAMLLGDPYYRTIDGFELLIEKEWLSYGLQFHLRHGQEDNSSEEAPIFLQFLESVWNLIKFYPCAFEFNEDFLIALFDHSYSGAFGTFMLNNEYERYKNAIWEHTGSLWHFLDKNRSLYTNFWYKKTGFLFPDLKMRHLSVWEKLFMRFDTEYITARSFTEKKVRCSPNNTKIKENNQ